MDARPRLLDRVRDHLRKRLYRYRTERQYPSWVRRFILFQGTRHPSDLATREVDREVSASAQNPALAAIHIVRIAKRRNAVQSPLDQ